MDILQHKINKKIKHQARIPTISSHGQITAHDTYNFNSVYQRYYLLTLFWSLVWPLHNGSFNYINNYGQMVNHVVFTLISLLCFWLPSQLGSHFHQHQYRRLDVLCGGPGSHAPVQYRTWQHCTDTEWCTTHQHHSRLTVSSQMKL